MADGTNGVRDPRGGELRRQLERRLTWLRPFEKAAVGRCPAEVRRRLIEVRPLMGELAAMLRNAPDAGAAGANAGGTNAGNPDAAVSTACTDSCANGRICGGRRAALRGPWASSAKARVARRNALRYARAFLAKTEMLPESAGWDELREARLLLLLTAGALEKYLYGEMECFLPRYA